LSSLYFDSQYRSTKSITFFCELAKAGKTISGLTEITDDHVIIHDAFRQKLNTKMLLLNYLILFPSKKLKDTAEVKHF